MRVGSPPDEIAKRRQWNVPCTAARQCPPGTTFKHVRSRWRVESSTFAGSWRDQATSSDDSRRSCWMQAPQSGPTWKKQTRRRRTGFHSESGHRSERVGRDTLLAAVNCAGGAFSKTAGRTAYRRVARNPEDSHHNHHECGHPIPTVATKIPNIEHSTLNIQH